ncbi:MULTISPECIES: DUF5677 domain-containing protein [unclassified Sphingomonas]|uniref:DUF5677 domain-containing protein n=1 Tax=Sphingomonas TaxID=13687 RepID=UPI001ACCC363|nr:MULTISPECIES: DUF5677 domain-containing protein [unclassified Sphingomonas]MBN8813448.1 hypothetical protein [Sphingomonas sp.]
MSASPAKKPMADLHPLVMEALSKAPLNIFARFLQDKVNSTGSTISDEEAEALAEHVIKKRSGTFRVKDDDEDRTINLSITADEVQSVLDEIDSFNRDKLPQIVVKTVRSSAQIILRSLDKDWPAQKTHDRARMDQFRENLEDRWGGAFDILRMMYTISIEIGGEVAKRWQRPTKTQGALRHVLTHLHARACQVTNEIICLMENGLADGAMARWRTLHEIRVVASLIAEHGNDLAIRYLAHEAIEAKRAMDRFMVCHAALGYAPLSKREIKDVERSYAAALQAYGDNFGSQYGWAALHLSMKKPRFDDLEAAAGQIAMRSYYHMASYNVHASTKGIAFRLGLLDDSGVTALAGASNAGFVDPAQNTSQALVEVTSLLLTRNGRFDELVEMEILIALRDRLPKALDRANRELERAHRRQLKAERTRSKP